MFVEDLKNDFYNILLGNRVLLLVHYDVDAVCTCHILQYLFKCDNISYTLVPVGGISELKAAYEENHEDIKYVVLVNCGGTIDLVDILQPDEDVVFFVLDSHKPTDVCNVYSDGQVRLVWKDNEENIPNFDDIFRDDEDENDSEEVESGREGLEAAVNKRRERRAWEERRNTLMFNYTQFSYYGKPSACVALEVAWRLSRVGVGALWAAGVAVAAQAALHARAPAPALLDADQLQRHVAAAAARLARHDHDHDHAGGAGGAEAAPRAQAQVVLEKDLWLPLYRVWSVEGAVRHAPALAPRLRLHALAGEARVRRLLADMGLPLQQARQAYRSMDVALRRELLPALEAAAERARLPAPSRAAFLLRRAFSPTIAAHDLVYVVMALLENESIAPADGFQRALATLSVDGGEEENRTKGVEEAQRRLGAIARIVNSTLSAKKLHLAGPFNYFIVQEGTPEAEAVRGPLWLGVCARWAAAAAAGAGGGGARPLVAGAASLLLGVPPRYESEPRNLFGAAFEQAASRCGCSVTLDYVDSSVVRLPTAQRAQFLDALTALLS